MNSLSYCHLLSEVKETIVYKGLGEFGETSLTPVWSAVAPSFDNNYA